MYTLKIKHVTKNNDSPNGKPKIYMTGHPADFDKYFNRFCEDIFEAKDCAIYYLKNANEPLTESEVASFFDKMNFVVYVKVRCVFPRFGLFKILYVKPSFKFDIT